MSVNGLSRTQLQCWKSATQHTANDGKPASVFSAANSNTFLGMHRFLYSTSNAHATVPKGKTFKSFQTLFCCEKESERQRPVAYLLVLVNRKEQSPGPGSRVAEGGAGAAGQPCAQYRRFLKHKCYNSERIPVIITEMRIPWLS